MFRILLAAFGCAALLISPAQAEDVEGAADHPAIGRYDGMEITRFEALEYDAQRMLVSADPGDYESFEGEVTRIVYAMPDGASVLQVMRSYEETLESDGFDILVSCHDMECDKGSIGRLRSATWGIIMGVGAGFVTAEKRDETSVIRAQIVVDKRLTNVNIVENAAFENKMLDAEDMASSISETGRVAIENIYFDFNKATLLPDSDDALAEMAKLLKEVSDVKVYLVGHTDNVGSMEANLDLSRRRAEAVVEALVSDYGVSRDRIVPAGVGPLAPIASNATEAGQAKNRRVELVQR